MSRRDVVPRQHHREAAVEARRRAQPRDHPRVRSQPKQHHIRDPSVARSNPPRGGGGDDETGAVRVPARRDGRARRVHRHAQPRRVGSRLAPEDDQTRGRSRVPREIGEDGGGGRGEGGGADDGDVGEGDGVCARARGGGDGGGARRGREGRARGVPARVLKKGGGRGSVMRRALEREDARTSPRANIQRGGGGPRVTSTTRK